MKRTLNRELLLSARDIEQAVVEYLKSHGVQMGDDPLVEFVPQGIACQITSTDETDLEFTENSYSEAKVRNQDGPPRPSKPLGHNPVG